jgi:hypothetical protein
MNSAGKGTGVVGYNVQAVVDVENHMIVAHGVTNIGNDRSQLTSMSKLAQDALRKNVLAYNFKRLIKILGATRVIEAMSA